MTELTTGVVFLMSSLYGAGQANATANATVIPTATDKQGIESITEKDFNDSKVVEQYVKKEYSDEPLLIEIARCESTFRQYDKDGTVIRGKVNKNDVGIMQINEKYHGETAANHGYDIYTVKGNLDFAKYLYEKYGASPWSASSKCWSGGDVAMK